MLIDCARKVLRCAVVSAILAMGGDLRAQTPPVAEAVQAAVPAAAAPAVKELLSAAKNWGYQLTNLDVVRLAASPFDVLVIDYSRDGSEEQVLKPADLERLKRKPDGSRRVVLSYLSIGEAEDYRYYWNPSWSGYWFVRNFWSAPSWLGPQNSDWGGNYAVKYWDPAWQAIILGDDAYLDRVVRAGFDGVWLDKVDSSMEDIAAGNPNAKRDMIALIERIGARARTQRPGFLVVPQNGEDLLAEPALLPLIDGYGKESLIYGEDAPQKPNSAAFVARKTALLKTVKDAGKAVLAVEYLFDASAVANATQRLASAGFVPLNAARELDMFPGEPIASGRQVAARRVGRVAPASGMVVNPWTWLGLGLGLLAVMLLGAKMSKKRM